MYIHTCNATRTMPNIKHNGQFIYGHFELHCGNDLANYAAITSQALLPLIAITKQKKTTRATPLASTRRGGWWCTLKCVLTF